MRQLNIFNYQGFLTDEDRKSEISHRGYFLTFTSSADLSSGVEVSYHGSEVAAEVYANEVAIFISWWTLEVWHSLNGFP